MKRLLAGLSAFGALVAFAAAPRALERSIKISFENRKAEFKWALKDLDPALPADWTDYKCLVLEMRASSPQRFSLWIHTADGPRRLMLQLFGQNAWLRAAVPLPYFKGKDPRGTDLASANNRRTDAFWLQLWGPFGELRRVEAVGVSMDYPLNKPSLEIRSVSLSRDDVTSAFLEDRPVVDEFGQWALGDWPRKIRSRDQLARELADEDRALRDGAPAQDGRFGGFAATSSRATGFFRVERIDGRWWFVDPDGHLFLSTGANGIRGGEGTAGPDLVLRRMTHWGLNTIGNWSSLKPPSEGARKAYVTTFRAPPSEPSYLGMPDVYSEEFARGVERAAKTQCAPLKDDPWLLGYFLGNEPPWPGRESELADLFLKGPDSATQRKLREFLAQGDTPRRREEFVRDMFGRYLGLMSGAVKKADPNHLNLGIRFGGIPADEILALGRSFDVFSLNVYEYEPTRQLKKVFLITGRPLLIGEFHFGVPAAGLGAGLVQTADQAERAKGYRYYMEQAAALPYFVGAHWFQWVDEPVLGRMDGENYNIGFVDATNRPYGELTDAAAATFARLFEVHAGRMQPFAERPRASEHGTPASPWE
jgi:hypothetical protein